MLIAPRTPSMMLSSPMNIVNTFIKLWEVQGDVACLGFGQKTMEYRAILQVNAINFSLMSEEEQEGIIEGFKGFLNGLSYPIQILIRNRPHNLDNYLNMLDSVKGVMAPIMRDHASFVRALASRRALVKREFYIIVPADKQGARDKTEALINAQLQLRLRLEELLRQLERMGLTGKRLNDIEIIHLYQSCYTPWEARLRPITEEMVEGTHGGPTISSFDRQGYIPASSEPFLQNDERAERDHTPLTAREQRKKRQQEKKQVKLRKQEAENQKLPDFVKIPDLIAPSSIQIFPSYIRIDGEADFEYVRTLALASYPRSAYPGWLDNIIQVDEPNIDFSIHIKPLAPEQVASRLGQRVVEFRGAAMVAQRQGRTPDPATAIALDDVEKLRENIARGTERVFNIAAFVQVRGRDRRELEAEYGNMCDVVKGQYVRLASESLQINPFELYDSGANLSDANGSKDEINFFREKLLNLLTLLELLLSDEGTLPQKEKAFLYKCLMKTYENRGITMDRATHHRVPPNMQELYVIMSSALRGDGRFGMGEDTYGLSERLERYLHLFPMRTRVVLNNRFIDFNIRELNDTLKPIGLFLIADFLWTKIRQARQAKTPQPNTIILIDEAWLLMQFQQGAKFLEEMARRIRKYGGGLWCTTQNSDDFLSSEEGKTILAMSTMKFLMKQDSSTIDSVTSTFHLSPGQRAFLLGARRGEGLFSIKSWTQMEVLASPMEAKMANTTVVSRLSPGQQAALDQEQNYQETLAQENKQKSNQQAKEMGRLTTQMLVDEKHTNGKK